ncbi:MAG: hypothetical protein KF852_14895 [Saprospiraceae bacterium]|nr:hypothetical protein [Saprospiraceae bacterium]
MSTYAIFFKDTDTEKVNKLVDFMRSLDFVDSVEPIHPGVVNDDQSVPESSEDFIAVSDLKKLYPDQWVLLANPQKKGAVLLGGIVLVHDRDKREFALKAKDLIKEHPGVTHFYTGVIPRHAHVGLAKKTQLR